jgi:hypothetical protein
MPDNRGFYGFFNEKTIKTYTCNRLLAAGFHGGPAGNFPAEAYLDPAFSS